MATQSLGSLDFTSEAPTQIAENTEKLSNAKKLSLVNVSLTDEMPTKEDEAWGCLLPLVDGVPRIDLVEDYYSFGRGADCNVIFCAERLKQKKIFKAISSRHFAIERDVDNNVFLTDLSMNGTYVNGERVERNVKRLLNGNEEIMLILKNSRFYMFIKHSETDKEEHAGVKKDYVLSRTIGKGSYGEVKLAFRKSDAKKFAVKILMKHRFGCDNTAARNISKEVDILRRISHPCIVCVENVIDTDTTLYIVLEYVCGGELFDRIVAQGYLEESVSKLLFYQIALAVQYLHNQHITHRDIKPENILLCDPLSNESLIKVTDFGLSKFLGSTSVMKTYCGTPNYLAPEILASAGLGVYTKSIDIWSMGVVLYACLCGSFPFSSEGDSSDLAKVIMNCEYDFSASVWSTISAEAKDIISKMMVSDPDNRLSSDEVLNHQWLNDQSMRKKVQYLMEFEEPPAYNFKRKKV